MHVLGTALALLQVCKRPAWRTAARGAGNFTRSASPTEQNVIFQNLGQRFPADAEHCETNPPGRNKAMPSDPAPLPHSRSLPVAAGESSVFTATFALTPGRNVWRQRAQPGKTRKTIPVFRAVRGKETGSSVISVESHPPRPAGRSSSSSCFLRRRAASLNWRSSCRGGGGGRSAESCQGNETRLDLRSRLSAGSSAVRGQLLKTTAVLCRVKGCCRRSLRRGRWPHGGLETEAGRRSRAHAAVTGGRSRPVTSNGALGSARFPSRLRPPHISSVRTAGCRASVVSYRGRVVLLPPLLLPPLL